MGIDDRRRRAGACARLGALLAGAAVLASLASCASSSEAGFGLPVLNADEAASAIAAGGSQVLPMPGTLVVERNGCFTWRADDTAAAADGAWVVWPGDARQDADVVVLGTGARLEAGASLEAVGAVVRLADLPQGSNADSYFGSFGGFCDADARGVVVLTEVDRG